RGVGSFQALWQRRTVLADQAGNEFHLLSVPDLVTSKKTARLRDWPIIELLVNIHIHENLAAPKPEWIEFWLNECRSVPQLFSLAGRFPGETRASASKRPLLQDALTPDRERLQAGLESEMRSEQEADRAYWEPLRRELEALRFEEARKKRIAD